jgi:cytosine/adenosine deaminase-related metal-dependent hydrolase
MTTLYCARWLLPISSAPILDGGLAVEDDRIIGVGARTDLIRRFRDVKLNDFGDAAILPGLINAHSHLELTVMRGFLDTEESDFFGWLKKLTTARLERMTADDLYVSAAWGACEAARAGITCLGDSSDAALRSMQALLDVGLRGTVYQESFGPDPRLACENFEKLKAKVAALQECETHLVRAGISPHAPYTVCATQLEMTADLAMAERLPLMMHVAESAAEDLLIREGRGPFAESLARRGIDWQAPLSSPIAYLESHGVLRTRPLLAHCINVDDADIETIKRNEANIAHCPKSNAKLGHGHAPLAKFLKANVSVGLGSDSVASNNTCDILEEARFAILFARAETAGTEELQMIEADRLLETATLGGARALGLDGQIGELREGMQADFIAVALNGAHQLPSYDAGHTLIFASSGRDVVLTVVDGKEVYREGKIATVDEDRLRARMKEISANLRG